MEVQRKILIVDDEAELRELLAEQLSLEPGLCVLHAATAADGMSVARRETPDLVIMDVGLPDQNGQHAVRDLRESGFRKPIILLSAHDTEDDTVQGLEAGANDYVAKPFSFPALLARIRTQLRVHEACDDATLQIGPLSFRPGSKLLLEPSGRKLRLTEKETMILRFLYRCHERMCTRERLLREVWGYNSAVNTHTLETHIYRLRQKIETDPRCPKWLVTWDDGYGLKV
jgi:DNA-binding response OmpR family regulator